MASFDEHLVLLSERNTVRFFFRQYLEQLYRLEEFLSSDEAVRDDVISFGARGADFKSEIGVEDGFFVLHQALSNSGALQQQLIIEGVVVSQHARGQVVSLRELPLHVEGLQLIKLKLKGNLIFHYFKIIILSI